MALRILENTSAQFAQERRTRALGRLNPDLKSLIEDEVFSKAGPLLFGTGFEKKAKERSEAVKCLRRATLAPKKGKAPRVPLESFFEGPAPNGEAAEAVGEGATTTTVKRRAFRRRTARKGGQSDNECLFCICKPCTCSHNKRLFEGYSGNLMGVRLGEIPASHHGHELGR